jgi:hypothetical protein
LGVIALMFVILQAMSLEVNKFVILVTKLRDNFVMLETLLLRVLKLFRPAV